MKKMILSLFLLAACGGSPMQPAPPPTAPGSPDSGGLAPPPAGNPCASPTGAPTK